MKEIKGKYNTAIIYTDVIEEKAVEQVGLLCDQEFIRGSRIRIMPDIHSGKGCVIGFTMDIKDKVCPSLVGVDIGCGVSCINFGKINIDLEQLDNFIRKYIPCGRNIHEGRKFKFEKLMDLKCYRDLRETKRFERSLGTLGGGNHMIELDIDSNNNKYLIIHSGSRNLGYQVATYYQNLAIDLCSGRTKMFEERDEIIKTYKEQERKNEIQSTLKKLKTKYVNMFPSIPEDLCYLFGKYKDNYLHDMQICQEFAVLNRKCIAKIILEELGVFAKSEFETIHNYISFEDNILRKGAVSAKEGELLLIPINMRDGCIIARGKGNSEWNYSAPHGAGRLMSRTKAREMLNLDEFKSTMSNVFTTSISLDTLDEAPMAYKSIDDIINNIGDTVDVVEIIKPIYNFKASE